MLALFLALQLQVAPPPAADALTARTQRLLDIDVELKSTDPLWPREGVITSLSIFGSALTLGGGLFLFWFVLFEARLMPAVAMFMNVLFVAMIASVVLAVGVGVATLVWSAHAALNRGDTRRRLEAEKKLLLTVAEF